MAGENEGTLTTVDEVTPETPETPTPETPEGGEPATPDPAKPPKSEYQKRIDQLTREKHEAKRQADTFKAELDAVKRKADAGARPEPPDLATLTMPGSDGQQVLDPAKYKRAVSEYEDKLHTWRQAQAAPPPAATATPDAPDPSMQEAITAFAERSVPLREQHADYDEVIERPVFSPAMREALWESEQGPALAYYLGSHQAEALRIANLPPTQAYREMGKLEAKLATPSAPAGRTVSGAPAPIAPVGGTATVTKDPEKMTTEEWMAWDRQRATERLKANPLGL